jgi:hypothetical protein
LPYSDNQEKLKGFGLAKSLSAKSRKAKVKAILALENPADVSIEACAAYAPVYLLR